MNIFSDLKPGNIVRLVSSIDGDTAGQVGSPLMILEILNKTPDKKQYRCVWIETGNSCDIPEGLISIDDSHYNK